MTDDTTGGRTTVDQQLPNPEKFGRRLEEAVQYLQGQPGSALSPTSEGQLGMHRSKLSQTDFSDPSWKVEFSPPLEVPLETGKDSDKTRTERPDFENAKGYAQISGIVRVENGEFAEYSFSLCILSQESEENRAESEIDGEEIPCCWSETGSKWRIARRLHFDIDIGRGDDEQKPMAHVQVGGEVPDKTLHSDHDDDSECHYCDSPLDKPRIPYPPTDPVILLDMVVRQYPSAQPANQGSWRNVVVDSEEMLWRPYHEFVRDAYQHSDRGPLLGRLSNGPAGD